jgi:protein SCO1/2
MRGLAAVFLAASGFVAAACSEPSGREYPLTGQILQVRRDTGQLTVKHEDIQGFMPGMVMSFDVADQSELDRRSAGELITATLVVRDNHAELKDIRVTGRAAVDPKVNRSLIPTLNAGEEVPDTELVDDMGRPRRLSDWQGSLVLVTFIYTRCPLPDFCPRMERHFLEIQRAVESDPGLRGRVRLLTVSFDPVHDTPEVLRKRAADIGALPQTWSYVTGDVDRVEDFAANFGVTVIRNPADERDISHNLRTILIGPDRRIVETWSGGDWTPAQAVERLREAAAPASR